MKMILKSKTKDFIEILNLVKLTGKDGTGSVVNLIHGCVFKTSENKEILVNALSINGVGMVKLKYKKIDVLENGELPIGDIEEFLSCLNCFKEDDEITIETTENKITIKRQNPKKIIKLSMTAKEHIEEFLKAKEIANDITIAEDYVTIHETNLNTKITLDVEEIKEILRDADIKNISRKFRFLLAENNLSVIVGEEKMTTSQSQIKTKLTNGDCNSVYIAGFDSVFSNIHGEVNLFLKTDSPMVIMKNCENYELMYLISPVVEAKDD